MRRRKKKCPARWHTHRIWRNFFYFCPFFPLDFPVSPSKMYRVFPPAARNAKRGRKFFSKFSRDCSGGRLSNSWSSRFSLDKRLRRCAPKHLTVESRRDAARITVVFRSTHVTSSNKTSPAARKNADWPIRR